MQMGGKKVGHPRFLRHDSLSPTCEESARRSSEKRKDAFFFFSSDNGGSRRGAARELGGSFVFQTQQNCGSSSSGSVAIAPGAPRAITDGADATAHTNIRIWRTAFSAASSPTAPGRSPFQNGPINQKPSRGRCSARASATTSSPQQQRWRALGVVREPPWS